jgi:branched-chain amino acid transport system ATP-binding protein
VLEVRSIDVFYADSQALFGLSLEVEAREIVTLVGSNGAGKTTTLRAISGVLSPRKGDILFEGEVLSTVAAHRRAEMGIALVPEGRDLWPLMSVRENLELGAYGLKARRHLGSSLEKVYALFPRLEERGKQLAGSLSGGEQQMGAIGRALMSRPRLLMLDEPSLGLAPILVQELFSAIRRLHDQGELTILLVEQNLAKALEVADRAYVIETGTIKKEGPSAQILRDESIRSAYLGI